MSVSGQRPLVYRSIATIATALLGVTSWCSCGRVGFELDGGDSSTLADGAAADVPQPGDASADVGAELCPLNLECSTGPSACYNQLTSFCVTACPADQVTFATAETRCVAWGGHVASVHAMDDLTCLATPSSWLGLQQTGTATPADGWTWLDGSTLDYVAWSGNQPDDRDNVENGEEQCARVRVNGTWEDAPCTSLGAVVCRRW
jgi:hypothetical protein